MLLSFLDELQSDFGRLVNDEASSDIKFVVGKAKEVRFGHSQILAARSPYFKQGLRPCWQESREGVFCKPNIEPEVFDRILQYLYTGQVDVHMDMVGPLVEAATEFQLSRLISVCEEYACEHVDAATVWTMLALASRLDMKRLWWTATAVFDRDVQRLLEAPELFALEVELVVALLSRSAIEVDELLIWKAIVRYSYHHVGLDHTNCPMLQFPPWPHRLLVQVLSTCDEASLSSDTKSLDDDGDDDDGNEKKEYKGRDLVHHDESASICEFIHATPKEIIRPGDVVVKLPLKQFLSLRAMIQPLLPAVRLTGLQVTEFAQYIEGTGLVPSEHCRTVYRYNSLPTAFSGDLAPPRWQGATLLPIDQWPIMLSWLKDAMGSSGSHGHPLSLPKLTRIFTASKDGFRHHEFHSHCDDQGPTLTIVQTDTEMVVGGFNSQSWTSKRGWGRAEKNFLFQYHPQTREMLQAPLISKAKAYASFNDPSIGPRFGYWKELHIKNDGKTCKMEKASYSTYSTEPSWLVGHFMIVDYEVFKVVP